ncbi:hypothetical protein Droror1_Dr00010943 [Drosera rotundifolia]
MSNSSDNPVPSVDVLAANDLIQRSGYRYLDVRTEEEFKKGHVDLARNAALNVPYMFNTPQGRVKNPEFMEQVTRLYSKEDHIIVGCQSGVRSAYATADLVEADFKDVKNMKGGYLAWVENGLPVTKPPEAEL